MSLVTEIMARAGLAQEPAERAAGSLLAALKLSLPPDRFAVVARAVPDADTLIGRAHSAPAARTGEMLTLVAQLTSAKGADMLRTQLGRQGLGEAQVRQVVEAFTAVLFQQAGETTAATLVGQVPALSVLLGTA